MKDVTQFGSHKITLARHGLTHAFYKEEHDNEVSYHYSGLTLTGSRYEVVIKDEKVIVNGQVNGQLNEGDSINIGDDGVTVNSMDYGETARYLKANSEQTRP